MKDIKYFAIFLGIIVTVVGSLALGIVLGIFLIVFYQPMQDIVAARGMPIQNVFLAAQKLGYQSTPVLLCELGVGGFSSLVGGFVTAWVAKISFVKNALIMSILSGLPGLFFITLYPAWYEIVAWVLTIGPAIAGGYMGFVFIRPPPSTPT